MDIHGEDTFGLSRENALLFRHNHMHHMYFNDFSVPSSKALKELEDIDALSKHVIMKGLNDDEPNSPPSLDPRTPPRHIPSASLDYSTEPSLKLEDDDELGGTFAFFRKPSSHASHLNHSVDDLIPQHHSSRHDFGFNMQPFDLRTTKPKDVPHSPNGMHGSPNNFSNMNHHDSNKNSDSTLAYAISPINTSNTTIINNINNINNISNISTINNISNINNINSFSTINTINNNINISININSNSSDNNNNNNNNNNNKSDDISDMDDKSAIHLISNNNSLEFLDDYITTGSNSSSSPDESPLNHEDEDMDGGLDDSTASLSGALNSAALSALVANTTSVPIATSAPNGGLHRMSSAPLPHNAAHSANRLHHSTGSILTSGLSSSVPGTTTLATADGAGYHSLTSSCNLVMGDNNGAGSLDTSAGIPIVLAPGGTTVIDGVTYNNRGYEVCGSLNKFNKPCQRIGRCPFHHDSSSPKKGPTGYPDATATATNPNGSGNAGITNGTTNGINIPGSTGTGIGNGNGHGTGTGIATAGGPSSLPAERRYLPIKKGPYKSGWKKDEHIRFLKGLQMHGKGSWKEIALIVGTRTPTQIQVHAHRYYLRQQQETKNKRSIHDISLQDLEELEVQHGSVIQSSIDSSGSSPHLSPPSPDRTNTPPTDLAHIFCSPHHHTSHHPQPSAAIPTPHPHHSSHTHTHHHHTNTSHLTTSPSLTHTHSPLSHSDGITNHLNSAPVSSPPISAPSSPLVPPLSSSSFPPLFSGSATTSSLSNTLPGLPLLSFPLAPSFSLNYHTPSWYSAPAYSMNQMSNLNSMTINMSGIGDVDLHLPPPSDHTSTSNPTKLLSPLSSSSFSHMSDDDYDDDLNGHHHHSPPDDDSSPHHHDHHHSLHHTSHHISHHSDPSSPEEEFPSDDD